jgi:hypothetical protein
MAGMVGSRNGWVEVPYVDCPAGIPRLAASLTRMPLGDGIDALIVPGLITRDADGTPDVMRGEETKIAGAGLDVFEHEPAVDPRLLDLPGVVVLPHMGSATFEGRQAMGEKVITNIRVWVDGHRPPDIVLEGWV